MEPNTSIVITSIAAPNRILRDIARQCSMRSLRFYVMGDVSSPPDFQLDGCSFFGIDRQIATGFKTAALCPKRHYARKNVGYLVAMQAGAQMIVETDDDNLPGEEFWGPRNRTHSVPLISEAGWVNVYGYFTDDHIWPRGLPLDALHQQVIPMDHLAIEQVDCPIQQGLADENPDVDAIYRLVLPLPVQFEKGRRIALRRSVWSPFNSQNTTWWSDAFPLLYLPAYCSFRMTDIWRSFVAQRIAWENGWSLLFESPTVVQERNDHSLIRDFKDEIPGYLNNRAMAEALDALSLKPGAEHMADNLVACYEMMVRHEWVGAQELPLLQAWIVDVKDVGFTTGGATSGR